MPKFIVNTTFEFSGMIRREGSELTVAKEMLQQEIAQGKHPDNGRPLSGLLNHCSPADDTTAELVDGLCIPKPDVVELSEEQKADRLGVIKEEMDAMGAAYHPGWKLTRFEKELIKARKEKGA